jgi:hypothetical protein
MASNSFLQRGRLRLILGKHGLHRFLRSFNNLLDVFQRLVDALHSDPAEGRLSVRGHVRLLNEPDRLEHICNVVKTTNFGLQGLVINDLIVGYLTSGLFKRDNFFPSNEKVNELLTKVAKRLDFLVLWLSLALQAHETVLVIGGHFNKLVFGQLLV